MSNCLHYYGNWLCFSRLSALFFFFFVVLCRRKRAQITFKIRWTVELELHQWNGFNGSPRGVCVAAGRGWERGTETVLVGAGTGTWLWPEAHAPGGAGRTNTTTSFLPPFFLQQAFPGGTLSTNQGRPMPASRSRLCRRDFWVGNGSSQPGCQ